MGVAVVLWAGWPQPHIRHHDRSSLLPVAHQSAAIQSSSINLLHISGEEGEKESPQALARRLLVDLNLGSRIELESLPGIGMKLADRIVSYRSVYGAFQQVEDLLKISGIGEKRLKRLEPFVEVQTRVGKEQVNSTNLLLRK